jgi:hypothetical protein
LQIKQRIFFSLVKNKKMQFRVQRTQSIEIDIPVGNTQTKFVFPDQPQLTGNAGLPVIIDSIETFIEDNLPNSPLTFQAVVPAVDLINSFLTIYQGDLAVMNAFPMAKLVNLSKIDQNTFGHTGVINPPLVRKWINVSWTKSFVQFASVPADGTKIVFVVSYTVLQTQQDVMNYLMDSNS